MSARGVRRTSYSRHWEDSATAKAEDQDFSMTDSQTHQMNQDLLIPKRDINNFTVASAARSVAGHSNTAATEELWNTTLV